MILIGLDWIGLDWPPSLWQDLLEPDVAASLSSSLLLFFSSSWVSRLVTSTVRGDSGHHPRGPVRGRGSASPANATHTHTHTRRIDDSQILSELRNESTRFFRAKLRSAMSQCLKLGVSSTSSRLIIPSARCRARVSRATSKVFAMGLFGGLFGDGKPKKEVRVSYM